MNRQAQQPPHLKFPVPYMRGDEPGTYGAG